MNHRQLWKKIFGDNDAYIDFYFKERADHTVVYSKYEGHDLVSMIFFNYYTLVIQGEKVKCPYIEGVATAPEWRHKGFMKMLLYQGVEAFELWNDVAVSKETADRIYQRMEQELSGK